MVVIITWALIERREESVSDHFSGRDQQLGIERGRTGDGQ